MSRDLTAFLISQLGIWIAIAAIVLHLLHRLPLKNFFLVLAFCSFAELVSSWMVFWEMVPVNVITLAVNLWAWWNSGGGDDTKKRLRKLKKKFTPVRRMAPVTA